MCGLRHREEELTETNIIGRVGGKVASSMPRPLTCWPGCCWQHEGGRGWLHKTELSEGTVEVGLSGTVEGLVATTAVMTAEHGHSL